MLAATRHAVDRAWRRTRIRLRPGIVDRILQDIAAGRASYLGKGRGRDRYVWGVRLSRSQPLRVVVDERLGIIITVLPSTGEGIPGYASRTGGRRPKGIRRANGQ